jgi:phosphatidylglycerol:prolipoprotein diacylglycerol transferase
MYPTLFELGPVTIYSYGVLLAAAYLLGLKFAMVRGRQRGLDEARVMDLGIYVIISALVGAKLMLLIVDFRHFTTDSTAVFGLLRSGGVFYGGLILAVAVALWYLRRYRMPTWDVCDAFAPGIALGHVVGRLGCLLAGCCYGRQTDVPWAIVFTNPEAAANVGTPLDVHLHPTQLYEASAEALILGLLLATESRGKAFSGRTFWSYILLYGASRFVIEFYRGDPRGMVMGLVSTSQFISLFLMPLAIVMLIRLRSIRAEPESTRAGHAGKRKSGRISA